MWAVVCLRPTMHLATYAGNQSHMNTRHETMADEPTSTGPKGLDWRAIMIAGLVFLIGTFIVAIVWLVLGLTLFAIAGTRGLDAVSETPFGYVLGTVLLLVPVLVGGLKVSQIIAQETDSAKDSYRHCLVFGLLALTLIGLPALMSGLDSFNWQTTPFYVAIIPTALLGGWLGTRRRGY
jgi:hypothetical protein